MDLRPMLLLALIVSQSGCAVGVTTPGPSRLDAASDARAAADAARVDASDDALEDARATPDGSSDARAAVDAREPGDAAAPTDGAAPEPDAGDPIEMCPGGPDETRASYPATWREGECVVRWLRGDMPTNQPTMRAHYEGGALYASAHYPSGAVEFAGGSLLVNLGLTIPESARFCEAMPSDGACPRIALPRCGQLERWGDGERMWGWDCDGCSGQGSPVRMRVSGGERWTEMQGGDGRWSFIGRNVEGTGGAEEREFGLDRYWGTLCIRQSAP